MHRRAQRLRKSNAARDEFQQVASGNGTHASQQNGALLLPLPGVRADPPSDFLLWQLADSAFPTGGFAHSTGVEAASQQGEIRNRDELREWVSTSLRQIAYAALPLVNAVYAEPERLEELDRLCDVFTSNHVANRASRLQGKAFLVAVERVFKSEIKSPPFAHLAAVFGAATRGLNVPHRDAVRLFVFMHLRSAMAAAVRLNIVGPMEGQVIQFQLSREAEELVDRSLLFSLDDLAQTAPLLEIWQGAQDRLYSRLFQS